MRVLFQSGERPRKIGEGVSSRSDPYIENLVHIVFLRAARFAHSNEHSERVRSATGKRKDVRAFQSERAPRIVPHRGDTGGR